MPDVPERWKDDKLERFKLSLHLSKIVEARFKAYHQAESAGALCIAVDAEWGIGKTFFVERWTCDLAGLGHPVIRFDAWINDLSDDPLIGLLATLKTQLGPLLESLPPAERADAKNELTSMLKSGARAIWGATGTALKGYLAQKVGQEAFDALTESGGGGTNEDAIQATSSAAIDKFVETAMESHQDRRAAIDSLKKTFSRLAAHFKDKGNFKLPLFVWVDELDRCRPDYAVKLLEGIKHLFDAQGVCFVVTTNLRQLGETVKAVYGPGFNGYGYLKRFFQLEYTLPQPRTLEFAKFLFAGSSINRRGNGWHTGLPNHYVGGPDDNLEKCVDAFAKVASSMKLSARTQMKVFRQAEAVLAYWPPTVQCVLLYVFALLAVQDKEGDLDPFEMTNELADPFVKHVAAEKITALTRSGQGQELTVRGVLNKIHQYALTPHTNLARQAGESPRGSSFEIDLLHGLIQKDYTEGEQTWLSIYRTVELVKLAAPVE